MDGERFAAYCETYHGGIRLRTLGAAGVRGCVVSLQAGGLAPVSVAGFVCGLNAISAWWAAEGYVVENPLRLARHSA